MIVKLVETAAEWTGVVAVRLAVFVDEQGVPIGLEIDDLDRHAIHAAAVLEPADEPVRLDPAAGDQLSVLSGLAPARQGAARKAVELGWAGRPVNLPALNLPALGTIGRELAPASVVGTARLYWEASAEEGKGQSEGRLAARIGRVAVLPAWRRRGLGSRLVQLLEESARARGACRVTLHAQVAVEAFYRSHGYDFDPPGTVFLEDGIPHRRMSKPLAAGGSLQVPGTTGHRPSPGVW